MLKRYSAATVFFFGLFLALFSVGNTYDIDLKDIVGRTQYDHTSFEVDILAESMASLTRQSTKEALQEKVRQKGVVTEERKAKIIKNELEKVKNLTKVAVGAAALAANIDVQTATTAAETALEKNYLQFGYYAVVGGIAVYTAYDIYDTYQKEGPAAALQKAGIEIAINAAGFAVIKGGLKLSKAVYPSAEAAWSAFVAESPGMIGAVEKASKLANKASASISKRLNKAGDYIANSKLGQAGAKLDEAAGKLKDKIFGKKPAPENVTKFQNYAGDEIDAGISWGKGIQEQGMPWEEFLEKQLPKGSKLPTNFKTFDFYDQSTGAAISAKTLNALSPSKLAKPEQVYASLKKNIDAAIDFENHALSKVKLLSENISKREVHVAIPKGTNLVQKEQIYKAVEYGRMNNIKFIIKEVK